MHERPSVNGASQPENGRPPDDEQPSAEATNVLPPELRALFERTGPGCLAVMTDIGVVHLCHAADQDIAGFANRPVAYRWMFIMMPTAPLIRLEMVIDDDPARPYMFESFLNVDDADQAELLAELAGQAELHLAFFGSDLTYRYTKVVLQNAQVWQKLDEMTAAAVAYSASIPPEERDFDKAKAEFMQLYP